jgi:hypothetical protein
VDNFSLSHRSMLTTARTSSMAKSHVCFGQGPTHLVSYPTADDGSPRLGLVQYTKHD